MAAAISSYPPPRNPITGCVACGVFALAVSLAHGKDASCEFRTPTSLTLNFGAINPAGVTPLSVAAAPTQSTQAGDCQPAPRMEIAVASLHQSGGAHRLKNVMSQDYIAYTFAVSPMSTRAPGKDRWISLEISASITPAAVRDAVKGQYEDTVTLIVTP